MTELLRNHLVQENKISFQDFVKSVQKNNKISLKTSRAQSKLVLIFLRYKKEIASNTDDNSVFTENLLIMLLKDKSALRFEDNGSPEGTEIIDFDDVMQAAIINIDDFSNSISEEKSIDISFINGVGGTTNYFIDFFDAEDVIKNKDSVGNVLKALQDFSAKIKLTRSQKEKCDKAIKSLMDKNERHKFTTKLEDISSVIYSCLQTEKNVSINKSSFSEYIQEYNYKVNSEFNVTKNDRDRLEFISMETDVGSLKLKKSSFAKNNTGEIYFNVNNNELTVKTKISDVNMISELTKLQKDE
ncbi:nucleoid-associated protein [Shewanella algae]|uniref:nucleoid-associated protein n=1 Tax=Shewanella algae TaxID=38313 RepID=UPI001AAFDBF6|nr:nucleoid-associated protein [Shewanella algae]MBO2586000.1 nucleoid-associated protein [Shewanella algae]